MSAEPTTHAVRRYYDQNTRLFLALGSSAETQAIHRAVWGPGVQSLNEALNFTNALILGEIGAHLQGTTLASMRLVDLGCGVGGSLFYLLPRLMVPAQAVGLTLSPVQARIAHQRASEVCSPHTCSFVEGDFLAAPLAGGADVAYSVEAYCHAVEAARYFAQAARLLKPGGRLILCDDFLAERPLSATERYWQAAYQHGWHVPNLHPLPEVETWARAHELRLISNRDLTPHLRLKALPDWLAKAVWEIGQRLPIRHPILPSLLGSMALQHCLQLGVVQYRFLVLAKDER